MKELIHNNRWQIVSERIPPAATDKWSNRTTPPLKPQAVVQENYLKTTDSGKIEPSPFFKSQTVVQELPPMTPDKWLMGAEENSNWWLS